MASKPRLNQIGQHRTTYDKNKKKIIASQNVCAICGKPVDKKLKYPNPMSPTVDHIIPIARGGHPSDIDNLQLAHLSCNRTKADNLPSDIKKLGKIDKVVISNRILPQSMDWKSYRS